MNLLIDSTNFDPSPALNTFIEEKLQGVGKLEPRITRIHCTVAETRVDHAKSFSCAFTVFAPGNDFAVSRTAEDIHQAVLRAVESVKRKLRREKTKKLTARRSVRVQE
ncbi:MAG: HPF/RaiA family ribosome-associated protein [Candidatus Kapaibacterium sp.]